MKKFLTLVFSIAILFSLAACGDETTTTENDISYTDAVPEENSTVSNEQPEQSVVTESPISSNDEEWKQFLNDYEKWVDSYVDILKKYKEDPTDMSILSDYATLTQQAAEWSEKADKIQNELEATPEVLKEYTETLGRILQKITEASY